MLEDIDKMLDDTGKRHQKQIGKEADKKDKISEISESTEITEITEITETTTFEQLLRKKIKEDGIVEVFEKKDGTLKMHAVQIMDKGLFLSLCINAVLFVLLLTNILGVW